jgi:carboxyl-terminal processing protease
LPIKVTVVRDVIRTPFVESRMIEGTTIAYLRLNQFGGSAPEEMRAALRELLAQNPTGLIFDLRRDPGGYLGVAVEVASQFLKGGQVVLIERDKNGVTQELKAKNGGLATNIPLVLLVDSGSASASEIVAAALKDHQRATLIGVKTYGKGSVQNVHTLSDKSELRVTIARFFSPKGNEINGVSVSPDIEVKVTGDDTVPEGKRDPQLDRAVQFLQTGK